MNQRNNSISVLVIDDKKDNLLALKALLADVMPEVSVFTAIDGPLGISKAIKKDPDVILLDIVMPGMDGFEVCEELKINHKTHNIPVVFVTALKDDQASRKKALQAGGEAFLAKPVDEFDLRAQIKAMAKIKQSNIRNESEKEHLERLVHERTKDFIESTKFNDLLIQTIPFGMDIVDETGTILYMNENLRKIVGSDALGKKCWDIYKDDRKQCAFCPLRHEIIVGETNHLESDGVLDNHIFHISHTGLIYNGKKAILEVFQDISVRKKAEQELIRAKVKAEESDRLKSAFLTNVSHEIRTPMNGILGFTELLAEENLEGEQRMAYIEVIKTSSERLMSTVNDLVEISKIETGQAELTLKTINVNHIIDEIINPFVSQFQEKNLHFKLNKTLSDENNLIRLDEEKITSILSNLIKNAIKYTQEGFVEVGCEIIDKDKKELLFYVKDTGIGIPKSKHDVIFKHFRQVDETYTRVYEGAGLGLSIVQAYVEQHKGKIWLESVEGQGSTFYFSIPYLIAEIEEEEKEKAIDATLGIAGREVLIVEDDESSFEYLQAVISQAGMQWQWAVNGFEAIDYCKKNPHIDLVLMDINMPEMNGYEAAVEIKKMQPSLPIIAQTAYAMAKDRDKALASGCDDYLAKPIVKEDLIGLIHKWLIEKAP